MKILVTSIIDPKKSAPNRLHHFINYLSEKHTITAICINDYWKADNVDTCRSYKDFNAELSQINIEYITKWKVKPFYQELLFSRFLGSNFKNNYDIIFNYNTLLTGIHTAKRNHIPMVYDLADDLPEMVGSSPQIPRFLRNTGKMYAKRLLAKNLYYSIKVTGISTNLQDIYNIPINKFELINNGVNTIQFRKIKTNIKSELGLEDNFVLGYIGVLREWVDFNPVYEALKSFKAVRLLIVGEEGLLKENIKLAETYGVIDKILFTGNVPFTSVPEYISAMDCCLIPFNQSKVSHNAVPLKLFEYMACEKPVISTRLSGVKKIANSRIFYADTSDEYRKQIKYIMSLDGDYEQVKSNRRFVVDNYDWKPICQQLEKVLEEAIQ